MYLPISRRDSLRAAALALIAALLWMVWQGAWSHTVWDTPAAYSVDALEYLARLKLAEERGATFLFTESAPRLGAPWQADWASYPMPDRPINLATGWVARATGLIVAGNLSLLAAHVLAVVAFYLASRTLGHRPLFSAATGLVFGFSYSIAQRGFSHYSFALAFVVPGMVALSLIASGARRLLMNRRWQIMGAGVAAILGVANPYFGFFFGQLLVFALLARLVFHRGRGMAVVALWLAVFLTVFALSNFHALQAAVRGEGAVVGRNYAATEIYGLRPIEFFIPPPTHRWDSAAEIGRRYGAVTSLSGELFFPYLGLVGIAASALALGASACRLVRGRLGLRPAYVPLAGWTILFATVGGVGAAFAFGVTDLFRATNRYSVVVLSLALLALASLASRVRSRRNSVWCVAAAGAAVLLALWDQLPPRSTDRKELHAKVAADRRVASLLEDALPAGAMVFQMPAVPFLEQPPVGRMTDYELFRPYLHSTTLRFSYGQFAHSRAYQWQRNVSRLPPRDLVDTLEQTGFAALYIRRDAYADNADTLEKALAQLGRPLVFKDDHQLIFRLSPVSQPTLPALRAPLSYQRWDDAPPLSATSGVLVGNGWFGVENDASGPWRWARQEASLFLSNATEQPRQATIRFEVLTTSIARFTVECGRFRHHERMPAYQRRPVELAVELKPGLTEVRLHSDQRARRAAPGDAREIAFSVSHLEVEFSAPQSD